MKIILAHGVFGPLDEMVMNSAPEIMFVLTMVLSWLKIRKLHDTDQAAESDEADEPPE